MRSRVEDHVRMILLKNAVDAQLVAHRGDLHPEWKLPSISVQQLLLDVVGVVLVDIHDDQPLGVMLDDLAAQLGADGPAAPRYQDGLPT